MKITNIEIAGAALCTEGAVRAAVSKGKLDTSKIESVFGFILAGRSKAVGLEFMDDLGDPLKGVQVGCNDIGEPTIDYSDSQEFE